METFLVFLLAAMLLTGCLLFILVLSPAFLWIGVVAAGIFAMAGLHYLLWGRLLGKISDPDPEEPGEPAVPWWEVERFSDEPPLPRDPFPE